MPLFEYVCQSCGNQFEYLIQVNEKDPETCPACGKDHPQKKISSFSVSCPSSQSGSPPPSCASGSCPYAQ